VIGKKEKILRGDRMPNDRYVRGRLKEYRIRKELLNAGFDIAQRSAGSHSPIDVFAIDKKNRCIRFVQCKPDDMPVSKINKILKEFEWLDGEFNVEFDVE